MARFRSRRRFGSRSRRRGFIGRRTTGLRARRRRISNYSVSRGGIRL